MFWFWFMNLLIASNLYYITYLLVRTWIMNNEIINHHGKWLPNLHWFYINSVASCTYTGPEWLFSYIKTKYYFLVIYHPLRDFKSSTYLTILRKKIITHLTCLIHTCEITTQLKNKYVALGLLEQNVKNKYCEEYIKDHFALWIYNGAKLAVASVARATPLFCPAPKLYT